MFGRILWKQKKECLSAVLQRQPAYWKTGQVQAVRDYVMQGGTADVFLKKLYDMIDFLLPNYINEGKNQLVIAVGCTGGKHRSVTIARALYEHLEAAGEYGIRIDHRDIDKDNKKA